MRSIFLCLYTSIVTINCIYAQQQYNIVDYGAVPDGKTVVTEAINTAIEACNRDGGGRVYIPTGDFVSGTIFMKDNVELYLEKGSNLLGSESYEDFPLIPATDYRSHKDLYGWSALIFGDKLTNISVKGEGKIDGRGMWQKSRVGVSDRDGRSRNILFISCNEVKIEGIKFRGSAMWNLHLLNCKDVLVDRIDVFVFGNKNNDGIDIDGCSRLILSNSVFDSDDDGIVLKSTGEAPCKDIVITNCIVSSCCNAIKAGTESTGGFKNISISNCVIKHTRSDYSYHFKSAPPKAHAGISLEIVDGGVMNGVSISNIVMESVKAPIYIRLANRARTHTPDASTPGMGEMRNISINNIVAYGLDNYTSSITSIEGSYVENVTISNMLLSNKGGVSNESADKNMMFKEDIYAVQEDAKGYPQPSAWSNLPSSALFIRHAKNVIIKDVTVSPDAIDSRIPIVAHDVKGLIIGDFILSEKITSPLFFKGYDVENYKIERPLGWSGETFEIDKFDATKAIQ